MDVRFSGITHYRGPEDKIEKSVEEKIARLSELGIPSVNGDYKKNARILLHGQDAAKFMAEEFNVRSEKQLREVVKKMQSSPYLFSRFFRKLQEYYATAKMMGEDAEGNKILEKEV